MVLLPVRPFIGVLSYFSFSQICDFFDQTGFSRRDVVVPIGTYLVKPSLLYSYPVAQFKADIVGPRVIRLLKQKREKSGLSMNAVAKRAGLSHSMISRVEHELRKPTLDTLFRISEALQIDLWPLIKKAEKAAE